MSVVIKDAGYDTFESLANKQKPKLHQLVTTTFSGPTHCDHCDKFLWGLIKQGLTCQTCGYVCHPSCRRKVSKMVCTNRVSEFKVDSLVGSTPEKTTNSSVEKKVEGGLGLDFQQSQIVHNLINGPVQTQPITQTASTTVTTKSSEGITVDSKVPLYPEETEKVEKVEEIETLKSAESSGPTEETSSKKKRLSQTHKELVSSLRRTGNIQPSRCDSEPGSYSTAFQASPKTTFDSFFREVIKTTKDKERQLAQQRYGSALQLTTTLPNFTQFMARIHVVREISEAVICIFTWEYPLRSWFFLFCYINLCFHPEWLILLPFIGLWYNISKEYFGETNQNNHFPREECSPSRNETKDSVFKYHSESFVSGLFGAEVTSVREAATNYPQNLQFIQNLMGWYVESYNLSVKYWNGMKAYLGPNWPLWLTALSLPSLLIVHWYFPKRYLALIGVSLALLANHPFFMALAGHLATYLSDEFGPQFSSVTQALKVRVLDRANLINGKGPITIHVFENQRWWAVVGWSERTLSSERDSWSDESGNNKQLPIFLQQPEPGYTWEDNSEWKVAHNWCQPINTDDKGWVYYDNYWKSPSTKPRIDGFTRRRLWYRKMVFQPTAPNSPFRDDGL